MSSRRDEQRASPWLDYGNNQIFFGDSAGKFAISPTRVGGGGAGSCDYPIACGVNQLQSPVFVNNQVVASSPTQALCIAQTAGSPACIAAIQGGRGSVRSGRDIQPRSSMSQHQDHRREWTMPLPVRCKHWNV